MPLISTPSGVGGVITRAIRGDEYFQKASQALVLAGETRKNRVNKGQYLRSARLKLPVS